MKLITIILTSFLLLLSGCNGKAPVPDPGPGPEPGPGPVVEAPSHYEVIIRGGTVVDGSGQPGVRADVALAGDRIVAVGDLSNDTADRIIDATGLVVAPGFINPHTHTHDFINPYEDLDAVASLMQGITTEIGGADGRSPLPLADQFAELEREGTGVNFGSYVGQGSIRQWVMGNDNRPPTAAELAEMKAMVRESMEAGAFGVSTGLEYVPGTYASTEELIELVAETRPYGGIYNTHLRSEGNYLVESVEEAIRIAREAGVKLNLAHLKVVGFANWGKEAQVISLIEEALATGLDLFADVYPYRAPDYGVNRPLTEWAGNPPEHIEIIVARDPSMEGKTLAEVATERGWPLAEASQRLLAIDPDVRIVVLVSSGEAMERFLQAPWSVLSTDGESQPQLADPVAARQFHRRSYGSYPFFFGQLVREQGLLPLEAAVRKATGAVADHLGLKGRGYIREGYYADLVIFDPATIADQTTWLFPQEYPTGIHHVFVNGHLAVENGQPQPGRFGRVLRHGQ